MLLKFLEKCKLESLCLDCFVVFFSSIVTENKMQHIYLVDGGGNQTILDLGCS